MNVVNSYTYKPRRQLFYIKTSQQAVDDFYDGIIPECLMKYDGAFGTYESPGLYMIQRDGLELRALGITYRPDDERIDYPNELESIILPAGYMLCDTLLDEYSLDEDMVESFVMESANKEYTTPFPGERIVVQENPVIVQVFKLKDNNKVFISTVFFSDIPEIPPKTDMEKSLHNKIYHDGITGHHNWNYLWPILSKYPDYGIQDFTFVHFNVKDFKSINVVFGHVAGNNVLINVVNHMKKQDWIYYSARCDNDNFAMMIRDMPEEETRNKLSAFFDEISHLQESDSYRVYYRCGVVPMKSALILGMMAADAGKQAQNCARKLYETEIVFFTDAMRDDQDWSIRIRNYLDKAIENDEFLIFLQPKYDIQTEEYHGAEALIRWKYKGRELIGPYRFIPIFETGGLISKLDDIVLKQVCMCIKKWETEGRLLRPISVNLSRKSLGNSNLVEHLTSIVDYYDVDHSLIDFELTESAAYDNQQYMVEVIRGLKDRGFRISMDDFGTGYSSLSLLSKLPFDTLKIDKSFVDGIGMALENQKSCTVIRHIISMAKELNLTCLAEGVEEKEQVELLRIFGCEIVQGYYYSKPLPVEEFEEKIFK